MPKKKIFEIKGKITKGTTAENVRQVAAEKPKPYVYSFDAVALVESISTAEDHVWGTFASDKKIAIGQDIVIGIEIPE